MHLKIAVLPGDYIGPEVMAAALPVLEAVLKKSGHTLEHSTHDVGGAGIDNHGKALFGLKLPTIRPDIHEIG